MLKNGHTEGGAANSKGKGEAEIGGKEGDVLTDRELRGEE